MNLWEKITGSDITYETKIFEERVKELPLDYQEAWGTINTYFWERSDFSGRNMLPILDGVLGLFEEMVANGQSIQEAFGEDINDFCLALAGEEGAKSYRDKWREQLNSNVAKKLGK